MLVYVKQVLQTYEKQLDWAPAETPTKIAGLGNSRNIFGKIAELGTSRNTSGNIAGTISFILWENCRGELLEIGYIHKLLIMGKLQGLRPCNFQGNSWKLGDP